MAELKIGQRIRVSKATLESGVPTRNARLVWSHTEGEITELKRTEINVIRVRARCDGGDHVDACVRISPRGPKLSEYGQQITILENPPEQQRLFNSAAPS